MPNNTHHGVPVSLDKITLTFENGFTALRDLDLQIAEGEFVSVLGPSGSGKSTLLRLIAGLEEATSGSVSYGGTFPSGEVAFVFQQAELLPWRTVLANVSLPLELMNIPRAELVARATQSLEQVELGHALSLYPNQLSGGMKMRVALARALITNPRLLLLDEPFAALDELIRMKLEEELHHFWHERGMTVLLVTHSVSEAVFLSQKVYLLAKDGRRLLAPVPVTLPQTRERSLRNHSDFAHCFAQIQERFSQA